MPFQVLANLSGIVAVHAALVPTRSGAVIVYFFNAAKAGCLDVDRLDSPGNPSLIDGPGPQAFCAGNAFLGDGRWVVAGGVVDFDVRHFGHDTHDSGEHRCRIFSTNPNRFEPIKELNFQPGASHGGGRWYPTLLTLANGEVLAVGGHPFSGKIVRDAQGNPVIDPQTGKPKIDTTGTDNSSFPQVVGPPRHNNNTAERYSPARNQWTLLAVESTSHDDHEIDEYPRLHLAPDGYVFFSTIAKENFCFYHPFDGTYDKTRRIVVPPKEYYEAKGDDRSGLTSVMLPILPDDPANVWVLACGAEKSYKIDITAGPDLAWESAGSLPLGKLRKNACAVLLPTGSVFLTGGEVPGGPLKPAPEIYHPPINWRRLKYTPGPGQWEAGNEVPAVQRGYHSVALLMPDGRVWIAGSTWSFGNQNEQRMEVYAPPYIQPNRVKIAVETPAIKYGEVFDVKLSLPKPNTKITRVVLIRCGSFTHAFNSEQRYLVCRFTQTGDLLQVTAPPRPEIAPPGNYMLFVLDHVMDGQHGRPCERAAILRLSS